MGEDLKNIFNIEYNNLETIFIPFSANNSLGVNTVETFTGLVGELQIFIDFSRADGKISDNNYFIDFGDGSLSRSLTAKHAYQYPGDYNLTLVVTDSGNNYYKSSENRKIKVRDPLPDIINMSYLSAFQQNRSSPEATFLITRYNSKNATEILSSDQFSINLSVSGNQNRFYDQNSYYNEAYSHLNQSSFFMDQISNNYKVIDSVQTTSDLIYGKLSADSAPIPEISIQFESSKKLDNFFIGSSGFATFLYYED